MAKRKRASKEEIAERLRLLREENKKDCPNCGERKDASKFGKDKRHTDGLQTNCKECCNLLKRTKYGDKVRAHALAAHYRNKEENNARSLKYYYENREHLQQKTKEWRERNKEHLQEYRRRYHEENYEKENEQARIRMKKWVEENPERHRANCANREARLKGAEGYLSAEQWEELLELSEYKCMACGGDGELTRDHIISLVDGGTNWIDNIQVLCRSCNCSKQAHHNTDYRPDYIKEWVVEQMEINT